MRGDDVCIIVMDVEWTAWDGARERWWSGPGEEMELVQIGAVKLIDNDALNEIDAFEVLVRPRINPTLDRYFVDLTGITQERLDREGQDLKPVLAQFNSFLGDAPDLYGFGDELWIVHRNCQLYGLEDPFLGQACNDIRAPVLNHLADGNLAWNSSDLPRVLGFQAPGTAHQALADSRCIAEALRRMRQAGRF